MGRYTYNTFRFEEEYLIMFDRRGNSVLLDLEDYSKVSKYHWLKDPSNNYWRCTRKTKEHGRMLLHRFIMGMPSRSVVVDHKFHNLDDCRKSQLRCCSQTENMHNSYFDVSKSKSGHRGITLTPKGKFQARIWLNDKMIYLGTFDKLEEAIKIREEAEIKYFGEYSYRGEKV